MDAKHDAADDDADEGGGPSPAELIGFLLSAPKRRRRVALLASAITMVAGVAVAILKPPAYIAEVKILAQRNGTMKEVATHSTRDESPTKSAAEAILKRDNLLALIDQTKLLDRWDSDRPPILRLKDRATRLISGPPKDEDKIRAIVGVMEKHLYVNADDTTITIGVDWPNAKTAYEIVHAAETRFLDARQESEVGMISDAIAILETHLKTERENLDAAVAELQRLEDLKRNGGDSPSASPSSSSSASPASSPPAPKKIHIPRPPPVAAGDPEQKKVLAEKQAQLAALEGDRQRKLADLNAQLSTLRSTLAPAHPSIVAMERQIDSISRPSDEAVALKADIDRLSADIAEAQPSVAAIEKAADPSADTRDAGAPLVVVERNDDDAETALARQKLTNATLKYDELQSRIRAAKIELDVAEAAFKYKYSIITPAEVPRDPKKPAPSLIALMGIIAGFALYFLVPAILDFLSGKFIMSWQARKLGVPLLGEIEPPPET